MVITDGATDANRDPKILMPDNDKQALLRNLPSVSEVLAEVLAGPTVMEQVGGEGDDYALKTAVREEIARVRAGLLAGEMTDARVDLSRVVRRAARLAEPSLIPVINATGVVVHTNLGRSPLCSAALERQREVAQGYSNLEYDLDGGHRGHRHGHAARLLGRVTGAEAAVVTNNCAAAVLLCLSALGRDREVIVSRGELVEIGGSFRVPDIMAQSGARLVEVGTTNRTRLADYRDAVTDQTALLLKVHRSNFAVVGFTEEVSTADLAGLGRELGLVTAMDLGSGLLDRPGDPGFAGEHTVREVLADGIDLVTFSGDKLLGGPQAGIVAGRSDLVAELARHPLLRALRPDKLTFAGLEAVLELHATGRAAQEVPTTRMLSETVAAVRERRDQLLRRLQGKVPSGLEVTEIDTRSRPGGGSSPLTELDSAGLAVTHKDRSADQLHQRLRAARPPVIGRIEDDRLVLDLRTVLPDQTDLLAQLLIQLGDDAKPLRTP
jgi:L-seryl-tRNA(Ser) seleniumtransferase